MAKDWNTAQINEIKFWEDIYIHNKTDLVYSKTSDDGWVSFAKEILLRHNLKLDELANKIIVDIGSGPGGLIKGLILIGKKENINFKKLIAIDPLMKFFKEKIGLIDEQKNVVLIESMGEKLPINDNEVDYVFCTNVIDHCNNPSQIVSESKRILKTGGMFCPSLHLVYNFWTPIKNYIKFIDTNHPFHLNKTDINKIINKSFDKFKITYAINIADDQPKFTFLNIFRNQNFFRGIKRFFSKYVLYTNYFKCEK